MSLSRRQFIQSSSLALCAVALPFHSRAVGKRKGNALPVPPLLESKRGQPIFLGLQPARWSFKGDSNKTKVWGINGRYLGPTIRVKKGDDLKLIYSNRLSEAVAMQVTGLLVPGAVSGGGYRTIAAGSDWAPILPIRQPATTCWYHAVTPKFMGPQVYRGLAGLWIIEDEISTSLPLPKNYGVDDFPIIIQDKHIRASGEQRYDPPESGGFLGDILLVNGVQNPYLEVPRGWVRLRMVNASNARRYDLRLSDDRSFHVIASDQGFLPRPVLVKRVSLAPGERREILLDMSSGESVTIHSGEAPGFLDRLRSLFEYSNRLLSTEVLTLFADGLQPLFKTRLPMNLVTDVLPLIGQNTVPLRTREFCFDLTLPGINAALWELNRIDIEVPLGSVERWVIHSPMPQSFHTQGVKFLIEQSNGALPPEEDRGWKDTVWVEGHAILRVYFSHPSSRHFPFFYYSQILEMADKGSVGQLLVQ